MKKAVYQQLDSLFSATQWCLMYPCTLALQAVLDEVAGRQVAVNNRAGRSNGQVEALISHVDALLASNGNSLFTPSEEPATVIQPARCHFTHAVKLMGNIGICTNLRLLTT